MVGNSSGKDSRSPPISRREFLTIAAVGLLARCSSSGQLAATPDLSEVEEPTSKPAATPTLTPKPTVVVRRPEAIKAYPDVPSRVVHTHQAGVWDDGALVPGILRQMLDASITELTGLNDAAEAWSSLFAPDERVAIKVNTFGSSSFWTHVPLAVAVTECLQEVGVSPDQIVIFDRSSTELEFAGYPLNEDGPGVRCYGTGYRNYTVGWTIVDREVGLSDILLSCHALINVPILKQHSISGTSFAMKNHYGTIHKPSSFHSGIERAIPELNALEPIRQRTRLVIGDVLNIVKPGWSSAATGDSILMSFDPVAHDAVGLQLYSDMVISEGGRSEMAVSKTTQWLENAAALGLGTSDPDNMDLVELTLA